MARNPRRQLKRSEPQPKVVVYATLLHRSWLRRTIHVSGDANVLIEYDARPAGWPTPQAVVRLGGVEVARISKVPPAARMADVLPVVPLGFHSLAFTVPTRYGPVSASIHAEIAEGLVARLICLRLTIADMRPYQEGGGQLLLADPPNLPLPAADPNGDSSMLPISAAEVGNSSVEPSAPPARRPWWRIWNRGSQGQHGPE